VSDKTAKLKLEVIDDQGKSIPFRAEWWHCGGSGGSSIAKADQARSPDTDGGGLPSTGWSAGMEPVRRLWSDTGSAEIETDAGRLAVLVRRGIHYDAVTIEVDLSAGEVATRRVTLQKRFDPKAMGWYGGESHMHVLHGRKDPPRTFADGARMAAADGLAYVQLGSAWDADFTWPTAEQLNQRSRKVSNPEIIVGWNLETPKCYMGEDHGGRKGNLHCYGHGWPVGLKDLSPGRKFFSTGPNFKIIKAMRRQGATVGCAHPVRSWIIYGNFVSNWASELPFDFVAGAAYDAVDILNDSPLLFFQSERLWYTLLNMGYKIAGTGNSDGALGTTRGIGIYRTYTKIDGEFTWDKLAENMKAGRNVATSGPFVIFEVDGRDAGAEFPADSKDRKATIKAWSGPLPGEKLTAVQLVRNGEVVRAWDLREQDLRDWETSFDIRDNEFAWYCVRVVSNSCDPVSVRKWGPVLYELAVANAVYFLPDGFERPAPTEAQVSLKVTDEDGAPVAAEVAVHDDGGEIARHRLDETGEAALTVPGTASLLVSAAGFETAERSIYLDSPQIYDFCRNMNMVWPSFYSPETFRELRHRLENLSLAVTLQRLG